jgi:hypothetical protein
MTRLRRARARLRGEQGSAELFAFMLTFPLLCALVLFAWASMSYRDYKRLPVEQVVQTYAQQFAVYGTDDIPDYGAQAGSSAQATVTGTMRDKLMDTRMVKSITYGPVCGVLGEDGRVETGLKVISGTAVACTVTVDIAAWPYATAFRLTDLLFGGEYRVTAVAFSDKGYNPNIQ